MPLLATLMSSVFCGGLPFVSRNLGHRGVAVFSILSLTIAFISSACIWIDLYIGSAPVWLDLFGPWFEVGTVSVSWILYYDLLTAHMLFTVTSVSLAVHIYAVVYMRSDPHLSLFMSYLSLFTFFMLVYVCGDNLLVMLVGWEGIIQCPNGYYDLNLDLYLCFIGFKSFKKITPSTFWWRPFNQGARLLCFKQSKRDAQLDSFKQSKQDAQLDILKRSKGDAQQPLSGLIAELSVTKQDQLKRKCFNHSTLFYQVLTGFLLGDGWLEKRGHGIRLGISGIEKFKDVFQFYKLLLFGMGYLNDFNLVNPLVRKAERAKPYYQIRTFTFTNLILTYNAWYKLDNKGKRIKVIPNESNFDLRNTLTPLALAIWVMGDGSGMKDGGFKISSHSFTKQENEYLCNLLDELYNIKATVINEKKYTYIRVWKRSKNTLYSVVKPFLLESCYYKFLREN